MLSSLKHTGNGSAVSVLQQLVLCCPEQRIAMFAGFGKWWASRFCISMFSGIMLRS